MSTTDTYHEGYARGWEWAQRDLENGVACDSEADAIRDAARSLLEHVPRSAAGRRYIAEELGQARGYRAALAAFERGRRARETFLAAERARRS